MNSEILAGLLGGGLALMAGLATQAFGAWLVKRRRVREIAGRYVASLIAVAYVADANRAAPTAEHGLAAVQVQSDVVALAYELGTTAPRRVRHPIRTAMNASLDQLQGVQLDAVQWSMRRAAFESVVEDIEVELQSALRIKPVLRARARGPVVPAPAD